MSDPRRYTSAYAWWGGGPEFYSPLPRRTLASGEVPNTAPLVDCVADGVRKCGREFQPQTPGFRACINGMLTASNLLATGVNSGAGSDWSSGYTTGLTYKCA